MTPAPAMWLALVATVVSTWLVSRQRDEAEHQRDHALSLAESALAQAEDAVELAELWQAMALERRWVCVATPDVTTCWPAEVTP